MTALIQVKVDKALIDAVNAAIKKANNDHLKKKTTKTSLIIDALINFVNSNK